MFHQTHDWTHRRTLPERVVKQWFGNRADFVATLSVLFGKLENAALQYDLESNARLR